MNLCDFFANDRVVREGTFEQTMHPRTDIPGSICYAANEFFLRLALSNQNITSVITTPSLARLVKNDIGLVAVDNPRAEYYQLHNLLVESGAVRLEFEHFIDANSEVHPTAVIGHPVIISKGVRIGAYTVVGDYTIIGDDTYVADHVALSVRGMQDAYLDGRRFPLKYAGGVRIGKACEVLTAAIIQKPYHAEFTEVGDGSMVSVRVSVGHGSKVGRNVMIAGGVQISGNCRVGDYVRIGPLAVLSDAIKVGDGADIKLGSVVVEDVPPKASVSGNFAIPHVRQLRRHIRAKRGDV